MNWRLLSTPPMSGATNMAIDVWLMDRARNTGESVFRVYGWAAPTLSLGRNQRAKGGYDPAVLGRHGIDVVRRPTGGRAILHWREVTYSVTAPDTGVESLRVTYGRINKLLSAALGGLGAAVQEMTTDACVQQPGMQPCFAQPSAGELVATHRGTTGKVVGSAQFREAGALLQHGSILLHDDQALLLELSSEEVNPPRALPLGTLLEREVTRDEVERALFACAGTLLDGPVSVLASDGIERDAASNEGAFRDPLWTWRR